VNGIRLEPWEIAAIREVDSLWLNEFAPKPKEGSVTDFASLVLAVDSTQVKTGVASLDGLTAAGARAEAATIGLGRGSKTAGAAAAAMAASAQASSRAAVGMAGGANTASLAMARSARKRTPPRCKSARALC
jgi:hypothetical protein